MDGQTVESDAWAVISNLRDQHPRVPNDCPTDYIVEALAAAGLLAASAPGSSEGGTAVTELREQIARAIANSPLSGNPEYALADSVMAAVGPLVEQLRQAEVSRDAYRDERDHLRGDYRRIRKDRDRLLLAWRSARRRALRLRGEQGRLLRPAVSPPSKASPKESAPLADLTEAEWQRFHTGVTKTLVVHHGKRSADDPSPYDYLADALLARYDIRERGEQHGR